MVTLQWEWLFWDLQLTDACLYLFIEDLLSSYYVLAVAAGTTGLV